MRINTVNELIKTVARAINSCDESLLEICERTVEGWMQDDESKSAQVALIGAGYTAIAAIHELNEEE